MCRIFYYVFRLLQFLEMENIGDQVLYKRISRLGLLSSDTNLSPIRNTAKYNKFSTIRKLKDFIFYIRI